MQENSSQNIISYLEERLSHNTQDYVKLFADLKKNFKGKDISNLLNYIIINKNDKKLLNYTIKEINKLKYLNNMNVLIDFILKNDTNSELSDLKVLAIKTLSNFNNTSCVDALLYCLNDKSSNYRIRLASAEALGKIGGKNAFESLSNIICDENEKSAYVKESAVNALGMLGDYRALDIFDVIINTKQMFLDKFSYLKESMVEALGKFDISKDKRALNILKKSILDQSPRLRITTIETLMNSDFGCSYDLIYDRLLYDDDIEVKKNALIALYNISDKKILFEVLNQDFPKELKDCAQDILNNYEDENE